MIPINLRMGQSTVLRFPEKPQKVILGNSNYYSVEFIENDVAIQPQGTVPTNLFIYGAKHVYGFLLRNLEGGAYDDLVRIAWKGDAPATARTPSPIQEISRPNISGSIGGVLNVIVTRIECFEDQDFYILDFLLQNRSKESLSLKKLKLDVSQKKVETPLQEFVLQEENLKPRETTKARLFLRLPKLRDLAIHMQLDGASGDITIPGDSL